MPFWRERNARVQFGHQLHAHSVRRRPRRRRSISASDSITLAGDDAVILAVPPYVAAALVPGLETPTEFRAIVNAHFRIDPPADQPPILGVLNATTEWIFAFPGRSRSRSAPPTG